MRIFPKIHNAFSIIEMVVVVTVVGIIASLAVVGVGRVVDSAKREKLLTSVETLNRATIAYRASGGDLSTLEDPLLVLDALKQTDTKRAPGLSGAKIDPRLTFVYQTEQESNSGSLRVYWNNAEQRFNVADSGDTPGIKGFELSADAGEKDYGTSDGNHAMLYADEDTWIWDYQEVAPDTPAGPSDFTVTPVPDSVTPPTPTIPSPPPGPSTTTPLAPPLFSIPGSSLPYTDFDLALSLTDPNPVGSSEVYYSIDYGNWLPYSGSITIPPGANVAAQAVAIDGAYSSSSRIDHAYTALPSTLVRPVITPSRSLLGVFSQRKSRVTIANPNDPTLSEIEYQLNAGAWQKYSGAFVIDRDEYPSGATILARSTPTSNYYLASPASSSQISAESVKINGDALGSFHDPVGGDDLASNLTNQTSNSYFEWGLDKPADGSGKPSDYAKYSSSSLTYQKSTFSTLGIGESFVVGVLDYYNGTIITGTGADQISLSVDLDLDVNGSTATSIFDFAFELINVVNNYDTNDLWKDADYVKLANPVASESIIIDGVEFKLRLEFGETSKNGIALFDEFYVLENAKAKTNLYGTLVEVGAIEDDEDIFDTIENTVSGTLNLAP